MCSHQTQCGHLQCSRELSGCGWEEAPTRDWEGLLLSPDSRPLEPTHHGPATQFMSVRRQPHPTDRFHLGRGGALLWEGNRPLDEVPDLSLHWQLLLSRDSCWFKQTVRPKKILCFSEAHNLAFHRLIRGPWTTARPGLHFLLPVAPVVHVPMLCGAR